MYLSLSISVCRALLYTCKRLCQAHANGMAAHSNEINYKNTQRNVDNEQYGRAYAIHLLIASHRILFRLLLASTSKPSREYGPKHFYLDVAAVALNILCKCPIWCSFFFFNKFHSTFKIVIKILFFLKLYDSIFSTLLGKVCGGGEWRCRQFVFLVRFISLCAISFHIHHWIVEFVDDWILNSTHTENPHE